MIFSIVTHSADSRILKIERIRVRVTPIRRLHNSTAYVIDKELV